MAEPEVPWSQYDQAYKRIHERLAEILVQLSTVKDPTKYLPVRLSDGSAFYNAVGGGGGGLVQCQIRNQSDTDWINEPFMRKIQTDQLPSTLTGSGNLKVAAVEAIPAGMNTIGKFNLNTPPGEANFDFDGGIAAPTGAGEVTIKTVTPANGETRYITDIVGGGNVKGYATIYWGSTVKWRGRFLADASVGEQLKAPLKIVGDGSTQLALKVYASGAGSVEAFWGMTW